MTQRRCLTKNATYPLRLGLALVFLAAFPGGIGDDLGRLQDEAVAGESAKPTVNISPSPVEYKRKVKVTISGSGFKPQQELGLLLDVGGAPSDISGLVEPKPVANEKGEFSSVWVIDDEIRRNLLTPTAHTIEVVDEDWTMLAKVTLEFKAPEMKKEKK
jgi:hypothetical protein